MGCSQCGVGISLKAKMCKSCFNISRPPICKVSICQECKKRYTWKDTRSKRFCCTKCSRKNLSNRRMGKGNPRFNNGWRQYIRKLDHIKECQICGENIKKLETHHKDGNNRNNIIDNLIKVCRRCHMILDGRFKNLNYRDSGTGLCAGGNDGV